MKQFKQPLFTIFVIFMTAYVLTLVGCGKDSMSLGAPPPQADETTPDKTGGVSPATGADNEVLEEIDPDDMRECTKEEFDTLIDWSNDLAAADSAIKSMGAQSSSWKKKDDVIKLATVAILKCDEVQFYHSQKPCKKMVRNIINPKPVLKGAYDAARIQKRCEAPHKYLTKFGLRPDREGQMPVEPVRPPVTQPPVSVEPPTTPDVQPPVDTTPIDHSARSCDETEFTKLKSWRGALDLANRQIAKLGSSANWKYDASAIESSTAATGLCESVINYHAAKPCQRQVKNSQTGAMETKMYTGESLRQQCQQARSYYYDFAQRAESLVVPGARLLVNTSPLAGKTVVPGYGSDLTLGQCVVSNQSNTPITYGNQNALVIEARVYPNSGAEGFQMFVLKTAEGLKLECYGLDYTSAKTSKREVVRLLQQKDTPISLSYELN